MKMLTWWLRVVGVLYLAMACMNLYNIFFAPHIYGGTMPYSSEVAFMAFSDAWLAFILELGVLGGMALYASGRPEQSRLLVLTILWAEVFRGIVDDITLISRGYSAGFYVGFIVLHLMIIGTGIAFLRSAQFEK